jgi:hypothetical protein
MYFKSLGGGRENNLSRIFNWKVSDAEKAINKLVQSDILRRGVIIEQLSNNSEEWLVHRDLSS